MLRFRIRSTYRTDEEVGPEEYFNTSDSLSTVFEYLNQVNRIDEFAKHLVEDADNNVTMRVYDSHIDIENTDDRTNRVTVNRPGEIRYGQPMRTAAVNWSAQGSRSIDEAEKYMALVNTAIELARFLEAKYDVENPPELPVEVKVGEIEEPEPETGDEHP